MKNNSNVPVRIDVTYTKVDLSKLKNVSWSDTGTVNSNQIAIGLKQEETKDEMPKTLTQARWLKARISVSVLPVCQTLPERKVQHNK